MNARNRIALALCLGMVLSSATPAHASADSTPNITWQVKPSTTAEGERTQIDAAAAPGDAVSDAITVRNLSDAALTLSLESFEIVKTPSGDLTISAEPSEEQEAAAWVHFSEPEISLPVGSQVDLPFELRVPADAGPGDYAVALMASMSQPAQTADGQQVLLDTRVGVRLYLRVLGNMRSELTISGFDIDRQQPWWNPLPSRIAADLDIENTGNVRLDAAVTLRLEGPFGIPLGETAPLLLPQLNPGDKLTLSNAQIDGQPATGPALFAETIAPLFLTVTANVAATEVSSGQVFEFEASETALDVPWALIALAALGITAVIILRRCNAGTTNVTDRGISRSEE